MQEQARKPGGLGFHVIVLETNEPGAAAEKGAMIMTLEGLSRRESSTR
jgi:hypothetical protein